MKRWISKNVWLATAAALVLLLSDCGGSRPVKYYILDITPAPATESEPLPVTLSVGRIATTQLYRADRLVYGWGPVELGTYEYERWAEPPANMMQDLLITSLRASHQYRSVSRMTSTLRADYIVRGHLLSLYSVEKPQLAARFSLQVELFDPKSGMTVWSDSYSHDEPVNGKKVPDVIEALDRAVQGGIQQLTANMGQYVANHLPSQAAAAH